MLGRWIFLFGDGQFSRGELLVLGGYTYSYDNDLLTCRAFYEASACRASMGRMRLGRISGGISLLHNWISEWPWRGAVLWQRLHAHDEIEFLCWYVQCQNVYLDHSRSTVLVLWACQPQKEYQKKQVHFLTWRVTCHRFGQQIFDVKRSLCTLMAPSFAWTRRWRNKVCSTLA